MAIERILIVDRDEANLLFFEVLLRELGLSYTFTARSGVDGIEKADKEQAQLVIVAWELDAAMSGTVFVQKVKAKRRRKYLPCLIYSKRMKDSDIQLTRELGFQDVLGMPFDKAAAKKRIKDIIDRENNISHHEAALRRIENYLAEDKVEEASLLVTPDLLKNAETVARTTTVAAEVYLNAGNPGMVKEMLERAFAAEAGYYPALQLKARFLAQQGKHNEAVAMLKEMADKCPTNLQTKLTLGNTFIGAKRFEEAKATFAEVHKHDADRQEAKDGLATVAVAEGNTSLAIQLISETENGYDIAKMLNAIAITQVNGKEFEKGIKTYRDAIKILGSKISLAKLRFNLALAFKKKGDMLTCWHELANCYIAEPSFEKAYAMLVKITPELKAQSLTAPADIVKKVKGVREQWKSKAA